MNFSIHKNWAQLLNSEMEKNYYTKLVNFLNEAYRTNEIYPPISEIFKVFDICLPSQIKVVILGQDPYHGFGQACGLSFSVHKNIKPPPSLKNIYKEVFANSEKPIPKHGNLTSWVNQGVFLLNSVLTVEANKPGSHRNIGWEKFTDFVIHTISETCANVVFLLWGKYAYNKKVLVSETKHLVLTSSHPSPLAAYRGFIGCNHFTLANNFLKSKNITQIEWDNIK